MSHHHVHLPAGHQRLQDACARVEQLAPGWPGCAPIGPANMADVLEALRERDAAAAAITD